jgi:hypothetical protein
LLNLLTNTFCFSWVQHPLLKSSTIDLLHLGAISITEGTVCGRMIQISWRWALVLYHDRQLHTTKGHTWNGTYTTHETYTPCVSSMKTSRVLTCVFLSIRH